MTFREFMKEYVFEAPAHALTRLSQFLLGYNQKVQTFDGSSVERPRQGLLGLLLSGVSYVGRKISDFVADHKTAISVAFWLSVGVAGAVAATLALWPAALAAVVSFPVMGLTIAGIVGANTLLQIGFAAGLAAAAASVGTYLTAAVVNTVSAIANFCKRKPVIESSSSDEDLLHKAGNDHTFGNTPNPMTKLTGSDTLLSNVERQNSVPVHTARVFTEPKKQDSRELHQSSEETLSTGGLGL